MQSAVRCSHCLRNAPSQGIVPWYVSLPAPETVTVAPVVVDEQHGNAMI